MRRVVFDCDRCGKKDVGEMFGLYSEAGEQPEHRLPEARRAEVLLQFGYSSADVCRVTGLFLENLETAKGWQHYCSKCYQRVLDGVATILGEPRKVSSKPKDNGDSREDFVPMEEMESYDAEPGSMGENGTDDLPDPASEIAILEPRPAVVVPVPKAAPKVVAPPPEPEPIAEAVPVAVPEAAPAAVVPESTPVPVLEPVAPVKASKAETAKVEAVKVEAAKVEAAKVEASKPVPEPLPAREPPVVTLAEEIVPEEPAAPEAADKARRGRKPKPISLL